MEKLLNKISNIMKIDDKNKKHIIVIFAINILLLCSVLLFLIAPVYLHFTAEKVFLAISYILIFIVAILVIRIILHMFSRTIANKTKVILGLVLLVSIVSNVYVINYMGNCWHSSAGVTSFMYKYEYKDKYYLVMKESIYKHPISLEVDKENYNKVIIHEHVEYLFCYSYFKLCKNYSVLQNFNADKCIDNREFYENKKE